MIKYNIKNKILLLLFGVIFIQFISMGGAVECGSTPTNGCTVSQNTTFNYGFYNLADGIIIGNSSITLDCNGASLLGSNSFNSQGILIRPSAFGVLTNDNIIKNCIIKNYSNGIRMDSLTASIYPQRNLIYNNSISNVGNGILLSKGDYNSISSNKINSSINGIYLFYGTNGNPSSFNNLTENIFSSISSSDIYIAGGTGLIDNDFNNIWNNTIINKILYARTGNNNYVVNGVENNYIGNATGPTSEGLYIYNGLKINSNQSYISGTYFLPNGVEFLGSGLTFDCNKSVTLVGNNLEPGIRIYGFGFNYNTVTNCVISNYYWGLVTSAFSSPGPIGNIFRENILKNNNISISIDQGSDSGLISENTIINSSLVGISIGGLTTNFNKVWNNNFIQNSLNSQDFGTNNYWNSTNGGNYWSSYDSVIEGCINSNLDQFCDNPYNITGSANNKDYKPYIVPDGWLLGPQAGEPMPVQVIADVDMVKGKTTLIRIPITFTSVLTNDTITPNVTVYWNGSFVGQNLTTSFTYNQSKNVDFWYVPQNAGNNIPIEVRVSGTSTNGINYTDTNNKNIRVMFTRNLTLTFVAVDGPLNFEETAEDAIEYIHKTYPLRDNGIISKFNYTSLESKSYEHNQLGLYLLLHRIHKSTLIAGERPERSVGVVPRNWFADNLNASGVRGLSKEFSPAVLVEEDFADLLDHVSAHELGHTYGLCDEYNSTTWSRQNSGLFSNGFCPNGDLNNDEILDSECETEGCPTLTLQPLSRLPDSTELHNFMGSTVTIGSWISKESYINLLTEFNHSTPIPADKRAVISGIINLTSRDVTFDNFYTLGYGLGENPKDHTSGDYSLQILNSSSSVLYNISFQASSLNLLFNGSMIENNQTSFAFTVPFNFSASNIILKYNGTTKATRGLSNNAPNITLISPLGTQIYSNQPILINWTASDEDIGTNLSYAVLFSSDNGASYNTVIFDHNVTWFNISSNNLEDGKNYKIKVLVTDGINTNESVMSQTFEIDNDLKIKNFTVIYSNNTERIFKISLNNSLSQAISNITWEFNSGESIINSIYNLSLASQEEAILFIYHNYSLSGNYNVSFKAEKNNFKEFERIEVLI